MTRPKSIWLLLFFFAASFARGLLLLIQQDGSAEAQLYQAAGIDAAFSILMIATVLLDAGTLRYLWVPEPHGLRVGLASIGASLVFALVTATVAAADIDLFRSVLAAKQEAAGNVVDVAALEFASSPKGLALAVAVSLVKASVLSWLLVKNRNYFARRTF